MIRVYLKEMMQKTSTLIHYQQLLAILLVHSLEGSRRRGEALQSKGSSCRKSNKQEPVDVEVRKECE